MAKQKEKEAALTLRSEGNSIGEIAKKLHVSKSTVSCWCRDISLSDKAMARIAAKGKEKSVLGLLKYSETVRQKRFAETRQSIERGAATISTLSDRDIYCIGLGLYWGEGYKKGNQEFGFTNSDPQMIIFYIKWLRITFGIDTTDLILRVSINSAHANRINAVEQFWSDTLAIHRTQFTKPSLIYSVSKKRYANHEQHMGTIRIKVRNGTAWRREVLGAIATL